MSKKKKEDLELEEDIEKIDEDEEEYNGDLNQNDNNEDYIDSSTEIAGRIYKQSNVISKNFPHLPPDVKVSNFDRIDTATFLLKSNTYNLWRYTKKIQEISKYELERVKTERKNIYNIKNIEDFKNFLKNTNQSHIWYQINQLPDEELKEKFDVILKQLEKVRDEGIVEDLYGDKTVFNNAYKEYLDKHEGNDLIDDFGLMNTMMSITEAKKARKGWGMNSFNTSIQITRNEDITKEVEEEPEQNESGFNKMKNKFRR